MQAQFVMTQGSLTSSYLAFRPAVGGTHLPSPPDDPGAVGDGFDGAVLIGTNKNEMSLFLAFDPALIHFTMTAAACPRSGPPLPTPWGRLLK